MAGSSTFFSKVGFQSQTFTSSGTFNVPPGVNNILAYVVAGGGGGGSGGTGSHDGGGGGGGGEITFAVLEVIPSASVTVSIGAGGSGGTAGSDNAVTGNPSYVRYNNKQIYAFAGLRADGSGTKEGGARSVQGIYQTSGGGSSAANGNAGPLDGEFNQLGHPAGGVAGSGGIGQGGGGGGSSHGQGGEGGTNGGVSNGFNASANSGAGGGGGCSQGGFSNGGNGGSGLVIIYWKKD